MTDRKEKRLIDPAFVAQQAKNLAGYSGGSVVISPSREAKKILGEISYGEAFAYLWRRFGFPRYGYDGNKELIEYQLTTPIEDAVLIVRPCISTETSFGYILQQGLRVQCFQEEIDHKGPELINYQFPAGSLLEQVNCALQVTIADLLRPVYVRDWRINICGRAKNINEDEIPTVERSSMAGYGLGGLVDAYQDAPDLLFAFLSKAMEIGNGDLLRGLQAMGWEEESVSP